MTTLMSYLPELLFASMILITLLLVSFWYGWNCGFKRSGELMKEVGFKLKDEE